MTHDSALEYVILVDEHDHPIGKEEKLKAHQLGLLHRAFSVFIYQEKQQKTYWLIQQRQEDKYHCGGLWSNTCCSHPREGETILAAGRRRLVEELDLNSNLVHKGHFLYRKEFDNGLCEHELDHVLIGAYHYEPINPDPKEVSDYRWIESAELKAAIQQHPECYTPWLAQVLEYSIN